MVRPSDSSEEEPDHLVTHNFVDDAVVSNDRAGRQSIEAIEERVKVGRAHSFAHGCRATDIGEQQTDWDYHSSHLTLAKYGYTSRTERWIASGLPVSRVPEDEATKTTERSCAQLAAWRGRDSLERPPLADQSGTLPCEHGADFSGVQSSAAIYSIY